MITRRSILANTARHVAGSMMPTEAEPLIRQAAAEIMARDPRQADLSAVNVVEFGADPTGAADSSNAIISAVERCLEGPDSSVPKPLFFPKGQFLITRNNVFGVAPRRQAIRSWDIFGAGSEATILLLRPSPTIFRASTYYLYDGLFDEDTDYPNATLLGLNFARIGVQLEASKLSRESRISCFRQFGSGRSSAPEQNWTFVNCSFKGDERFAGPNGSILEIAGNANGSENAFINCRALRFRHVIDCSNPQAVNHLSLFCHWELIAGDMFRFIRGGNLTLFGGSLIMNNFGDAPEWKPRTTYSPNDTVYFDGRRFRTTEGGGSGDRPIEEITSSHFDGGVRWGLEEDESSYVLRVGGDVTGQINAFVISGVRIELRSNRSKLLAGGDLNTGALVTFSSVAVQPVVGGPRHTIELADSSASVEFIGCKLSRASSKWEEPVSAIFGRGPTPHARPEGARILFDGCAVSETIHKLLNWEQNSNTKVSLHNCTTGFREPQNFSGQSRTVVIDGTLVGEGRSNSCDVARYGRHLRVPFDYWPRNRSADSITISLPPQAILLKVYFQREKSSNGPDVYRIFLQDDRGNDLFSSDTINLRTGFQLESPRLYAQALSRNLNLSIRGADYGGAAVNAASTDCIIIEWIG